VTRSTPSQPVAAAVPDPRRRGRRYTDAGDVVRRLQPSYPVHCLRPHVFERAARRFVDSFPGTTLYAVKCNPHPAVLRALHTGGVHAFDTASLSEIARVAETFDDAECFFMHPVKPRPAIAGAHRVYGVRHYVVDLMAELHKLAQQLRNDPEVTVMVRLKTTESAGAFYHLSAKFGAEEEDAAAILAEVARLGMKPGLAFHVGSQCLEPEAYTQAVARAGSVAERAGVALAALDVGGGFPAVYPGTQAPDLSDYMAAIRHALGRLNLPEGGRVLCEPGRALVADGQSLLVQVHLRKGQQLYLNDGVYGSLSEMTAAGVRYPARLIRLEAGRIATPSAPEATFDAYGPTCDSLDTIPQAFRVPADVREGDWIEIDRVGAYSNALSTDFNGFRPDTFVEVQDEPPGERS
jgi:ornithine decarboxylase